MGFFNCTNHLLTEAQKKDVSSTFRGTSEFYELSDEAKRLFSQVPAQAHLDIAEYCRPICDEIRASGAHIVMVQGESTVSYYIVSWCQKRYLTTVAAVSRRDTVEKDGVKTSVFSHAGFREYKGA